LGPEIVISLGGAANLAEIVSTKCWRWDEFATRLTAEPPVSDNKASQGWYCPAEFKPAYRDTENFVARYALTFDYDKVSREDVQAIEECYREYAYAIYTTWSHTKEQPRVRLVFPLSRPATLEEFCAVTRKHGARFDIEKLARESDTPAQMMFLPAKRPDGTFKARINVGKWVDVDAVLAEYADWHDKSQWPRRMQGDSTHATAEGLTPPDEKPGLVGDFCRTWRIPEAIEHFELPYLPGSEGRYTYTKGTRPDGLRLYDDGLKAHSEHDSDPARGQNNAFDLVRIHKFGSLDAPADFEKPITERPSYREMVRLAMEQPELQAVSVANEFVDLGPLSTTAPNEAASSGSPVVLARPLVDVLSTPTIPRWLLRDKLERGVIALMAGPRGSYKSFIATDWGMEVATEVGAVYTLSAEGADYDRRARAWLKAKGGDPAIPMYVAERRIDLNDHENIELIRQDCIRLGIRPVLFVLDTFSKLSGGLDENSNTEVKSFIGRLDNGLKRAFDATVLLIAHTGHAEKGRARGASALEADTDAAYIVSRNESLKNVSITRQRFKSSPELDPLWLEPKVIDLGYEDNEARRVTSLVMMPALKKDQPASPTKGLNARQQAGLKLISAALAGTPDGTLTSDQLVELMVEATVKPEVGARDTRGQVARRILQSLLDKEVLFMKRNGRVAVARSEFTEDFE